jgi:hypothetical protein
MKNVVCDVCKCAIVRKETELTIDGRISRRLNAETKVNEGERRCRYDLCADCAGSVIALLKGEL